MVNKSKLQLERNNLKHFNKLRYQYDNSGIPIPRVYYRAQRGKRSPRFLVKCGDCDRFVEIYYDHEDEGIEINGVFTSREQWKKILLPLLAEPS